MTTGPVDNNSNADVPSADVTLRSVGALSLVVVALLLLMAGIEYASLPKLEGIFAEMSQGMRRQFAWAWLPWFAAAPLIAWTGARFRPRVAPWFVILLIHVAVYSALVGTNIALGPAHEDHAPVHVISEVNGEWATTEPPIDIIMPDPPEIEMGVDGPAFALLSMLPIYAVLALAIQALLAFSELKDRKVGEARLRNELTQAQLAALRMQVKPHFLFNVLNSVNALMANDVERARTMLADLSILLRASFVESDQHEVALADELELVEHYVRIQEVRFGDRLALRLDIAPEALQALVPSLCLQPLIENSIVHGVEKCIRPCTIELRAQVLGDQLRIDVVDNGPGKPSVGGDGIGLSNTRARLLQLYGDRAEFEAGPRDDGGFAARMILPVQKQ